MKSREGTLRFAVAARHLRQLGRELVADRTTALAELVKNAYDADAHHAWVHFRDPAKGGCLEVRDDGSGMKLDDIEKYWMCLSTDVKDREPRSARYGRLRAGRKGIGRFATASLGSRLKLSTKVQGQTSRAIVEFDWSRFEQGDVLLADIDCPFRLEPADAAEHGTLLQIDGIYDDWSDSDIGRLRSSLLLLQPPFPVGGTSAPTNAATLPKESDPGFEVLLRLRDTDALDLSVWQSEVQRFLDSATAVVEASVDELGQGRWSVRSRRLPIDEQGVYSHPIDGTGPFYLHAWYFVYARGAIGDLELKLARDMGTKYGGIRIYRDGLRVPPYGNPGTDWLGLDVHSRRRELLYPVANMNWFGYVDLSYDRNPLLIDTASREGVIENEAFHQLRAFVADALIDSGARVARVRGKKERARKRPTPETRQDLVGRVLDLGKMALDLAEKGQLDDARSTFSRALDAMEEAQRSDREAVAAERELLTELALLRVLAALGTSIVVFGHEVRSTISAAIDRLTDIEEDVRDVPSPWREHIASGVALARQALERLDGIALYIEGYASRSRVRDREPLALHSVLHQFADAFAARLAQRYGVTLEWSVQPASLRTEPMARSECDAILINLLTNALKAFQGCTHQERKIKLTAHQADSFALVRFQDTGRGIDPAIRPIMFEPFSTTTLASDSSLGSGTGLGLKIVRDIAEGNGGSADVGSPDNGYATCLEVRLPSWKPTGAQDEA